MDPLSLGTVSSALVTIAMTVLDKINKLEGYHQQETQAAEQYKRALVEFARDAQDVTGKLEAIVNYGNSAAVSALLDTHGGRTAFDGLRGALDDADQLLSTQECAVDALLATSRTRTIDVIALLSDADGDYQKFTAVMGDATTKLDDARGRIMRLSKQFSELYGIHGTGRAEQMLSPRLPADPRGVSPMSPDPLRKALDVVQSACYDNPFQIRLDKDCALEVAREIMLIPGSSRDRGDIYSVAVKGAAEQWVVDAVHDSVLADLAQAQVSVVQSLAVVLSAELAAFQAVGIPSQSESEAIRCAHLTDMCKTAQKGIDRENSKRFSLAFCGMVKAGKSLFLNALMGQMILPSDELPSTAWPCRVQHVKGQLTPSLDIDAPFFQRLIAHLQKQKFGLMMVNYQPPGDSDPFSALLDDNASDVDAKVDSDATALANRMREVYFEWVDLHPVTKTNLLKFEREGYRIPEGASGEEHVMDLLAQVNDIVRLCRRFNISVPNDKNLKWPTLRIDFEALRDEKLEGDFEFIDLPGVGEHSDTHFSFEDLVRNVASEVNAVVPIVSFKEIAKNSWRQELPTIVKNGVGRPPDLVLCTHLDQVPTNRVTEQMASVAKAFWPQSTDPKKRVLCCASRMGFSARAVLRLSQRGKPNFKQIWMENSIEHECAEKILGAHKPEVTYQRMDFSMWKKAVDDLLIKSELTNTIKRLVTDMIVSSRRRALMDENMQLHKQLRKAINNEHRTLLAMRRSVDEREQAYMQFKTVKDQYDSVLREWSGGVARMELQAGKKLQDSFAILQREAEAAAKQAVDNAVRQLKGRQMDVNAEEELVFFSVVAAERFLQQVQTDLNKLLSELKRKFVNGVRGLANRLRTDHFKTLKLGIEHSISDDMQQDLREEIIEELGDRSSNIQALAFHNVRRKVMHTIATRHNASSAYHALQATIAKPFLRQAAIDEFRQQHRSADEDEEAENSIEELGFMLRAPIAVLAAVPWFLGAGIWPFMKRSEKHILNQADFLREVKRHTVRPFYEALKREGQTTMDQIMQKSADAAQEAVKDALANEEKRFENERSLDKNACSPETVASAVSTLLDFLAAEVALCKLQELLKANQKEETS